MKSGCFASLTVNLLKSYVQDKFYVQGFYILHSIQFEYGLKHSGCERRLNVPYNL